MFPNLGYLLRWFTGWNISLPIPTFGFCMALSFWAAYVIFTLEFRRKQRMGAISPNIPIGRLMDRLLLWCGLIGFAGALLLAKLEGHTGLNYFGGLLFGMITYLFILHRKGIALTTALDIGSPGMMLAYAIGRIGCHLAGDGDWGIISSSPKPAWLSWAPDWVWAAHYPHNAIRQGVFLSGCHGDYCSVLPAGVFPTSLYESLVCLALFFTLWTLRRRLTVPGSLFFVYALFTGLERFLVEFIRITPKHLFLGLSLSQAQWIALGFLLIGLSGIGYILTTSAKKAYFYQSIVCPDRS